MTLVGTVLGRGRCRFVCASRGTFRRDVEGFSWVSKLPEECFEANCGSVTGDE